MTSTEASHQTAAPAIPWRRAPGWERVPWSLGAICVGLAVVALAGLLQSVLTTSLFEELRNAVDDYDFDFKAWEKKLALYYQVFPLLMAAGYGILAAGVARLGAAPSVSGARTIGAIGCAAMILTAIDEGLLAVSMMGDKPGMGAMSEFMSSEVFLVASVLVSGVGFAALLSLVDRVSSAVGRPLAGGLRPLAWLWIAWEVGFPLVMILLQPEFEMRRESPWAYLVLTRGSWLVGLALLGAMVLRLQGALERPATGVHADVEGRGSLAGDPADTGLWSDAASGLELYAAALSWRIFLSVGMYFLLVFAAFSRSPGLSKFLAFGLPMIAVITSVVMLVGVMRYARQPDTSPAGGAAWISGALMGFGVLMEFYGLFLVLRLLAPENVSYRELHDTAETAQSLSIWSMGVAFGSLLALLVSFGQLARHLRESRLVDRITGTGIFFAIIAFLVVGFRSYVSDARASDGGTLIVMGLAILVGALVAVVAYLNLVNAVARTIRDSQSQSELPSARVV